MAALSAAFADYTAWHISYHQVGLLRYEVEGLEDLSAIAARARADRAFARDMAKLNKLAAGTELTRKKRKGCGAGGGKKLDGSGDGGGKKLKGSHAGPPGDVDGFEVPEGDSADESHGFDDDGPLGGSELHFSDEESVHGAVADGIGDEDEPPLAAPLEPPPDAPAPRPRIDFSTGRALGPDGEYWGRATLVRQGQKSESLCIYCSRHGCNICKRVAAGVPGTEEILDWFVAGQAMPKGRLPGLVTRHKSLWPS